MAKSAVSTHMHISGTDESPASYLPNLANYRKVVHYMEARSRIEVNKYIGHACQKYAVNLYYVLNYNSGAVCRNKLLTHEGVKKLDLKLDPYRLNVMPARNMQIIAKLCNSTVIQLKHGWETVFLIIISTKHTLYTFMYIRLGTTKQLLSTAIDNLATVRSIHKSLENTFLDANTSPVVVRVKQWKCCRRPG